MEPIERDLDEADATAGLVSLTVPETADGTFHTVTTDAEPTGDAKSVKWVRVETEDGLTMDGDALSTFVLDTLNDPRRLGRQGPIRVRAHHRSARPPHRDREPLHGGAEVPHAARGRAHRRRDGGHDLAIADPEP
ncbi:hypothetical protein GCM10025876_26570 [Demequina litorisediminis]|uniref:Uncharacterized protein n=1 Tax=Demequina litorisediminis TaxID=1849022 RepID=A0ABQ6IIA5_9MICO|nr:hypothetical protein GCM10025876_26570 [Demequina litorisediminis]